MARVLTRADNAATIAGLELLAAAQGSEFRRPHRPSAALEAAVATIRSAVPACTGDRFLKPDIDAAIRLVLHGAFLDIVPDDLRSYSATEASAT